MKKGTCLKCKSTDVYKSGARRANGISVMNISQFSAAWLENYVCAACGYVESYVMDADKMEKIRQKWKKATEL